MLAAYADQNFLIAASNDSKWQDALVAARRKGLLSIVLSPWHFYEFANDPDAQRRDAFLTFVEAISPSWIPDRADLQLQEFLSVWIPLWGNPHPPFKPICDLAEASAALLRTHPKNTIKYGVRDFVAQFTKLPLGNPVKTMMETNTDVASANRKSYLAGQMTGALKERVKERYIACLLARMKGLIVPEEVDKRAQSILSSQPLQTMIATFIYWEGMSLLKTYQVESALTDEFYLGTATLDGNRLVDRQHAVVALSHCDVFITNDKDLIKRCEAIQQSLTFSTAKIQRHKQFVDDLLERLEHV